MTIQRQYNLPNCTLLLEGISTQSMFQPETRPVMDILTRAECRFLSLDQSLSGGMDFFESLVKAVSLYAQGFLSGIHVPLMQSAAAGVQIQPSEGQRHRLKVEMATPAEAALAQAAPKTVDLTTLQLFDLVDAIDQFIADTQTLPVWELSLAPVASRLTRRGEPLAKQAVPAAIGVSGLALAGLALFALPVPPVSQPENLKISANPPTVPSPSPVASPSSTAAASPTADAAPPSSSPIAPAADLAKLESSLNTAPEITDPKDLATLSQQLSKKVSEKLAGKTFDQELIYRVGVAKNGDILGYKPANEAANVRIKDTPLASLYYVPPDGAKTQEPIAQFKVTFPPKGNVRVEPWAKSEAALSSPAPAQAGSVGEIVDQAQVKELQPKLYDQVNNQWSDRQAPPSDALFRVRVKADGAIVDYEALNAAATEFVKSTPLPQLGKAIGADQPTPEPLAAFKVVFTTNEVLQVSPWYGKP